MRNLLRRIQYLLRRKQIEADLAEEMEFHRARLMHDHSDDSAAASRAWGNTTLAREDARAVWIFPWIESFWKDLIYGVRCLRREPGFTAVALTALAVSIGLNTSLFTVFNAIALRPWPVKDPAYVVNVIRLLHKGPEARQTSGFGVVDWRYVSEHAKAFKGLILTRNGERVQVEDRPLSLTWVSANYFSILGVDMARGRGFLEEEDRPQEPQAVAVLNYTTWRNRFGGDPSIIGRTVRLDQIPFTVVGVAPEGFTGTDPLRADFWVPFSARRLLRPADPTVLPFLTGIDYCCSSMAGRLSAGFTAKQAATEIDVLLSQLHHKSEKEEGRSVLTAGTAMLDNAGRNKEKIVPVFSAMFLAVTLVLLLACANVGNLLLARAAARRQEIAIRLSLGGSRSRLIRQLMMESLVLASSAAALGLALAWTIAPAIIRRLIPDFAPTVTPNLWVCAYTAGLAVLACFAFGLAPALHGTRGQIAGALKRESPLGISRVRLRSLLLAAQVAISVILLGSAGLLVRGLQRAEHLDPGFRIDSVSIAELDLPAAAYSGTRAQLFTNELQTALAQATDLPKIAITADAPMANSRSWTTMRRGGDTTDRDQLVQIHEVTSAYFDVLHIPVVAGRNFTSNDAHRSLVLLNETAAHRFWGGQSPVGKTIQSNGKSWEVVGVVKDAFTTDLNTIPPMMYWPMTNRSGVPELLIGDGNRAVLDRITAIVRGLEPQARITFKPLSDNLQSALQPARYAARIAGALGLLALGLAGIGMSGVFAYIVRQRIREIGVRMALGAQPAQVIRLVLASNLRALAGGVAVGIAGGVASARLLQSVMNGIRPFDPVTYAGVLMLLIIAAAAASALPARRAARVDPLTALHWE